MPDDIFDTDLPSIETELAQQRTLLVAVRGIAERLSMQHTALRQVQSLMQHTLTQHGERLHTLQQTLDAIKDLLERPNGH